MTLNGFLEMLSGWQDSSLLGFVSFVLLLKSTLLLLGFYAVVQGLRTRSSAGRHLLWALALVGVLLLPAVALLGPELPLPLLPEATRAVTPAGAASGPALAVSSPDVAEIRAAVFPVGIPVPAVPVAAEGLSGPEIFLAGLVLLAIGHLLFLAVGLLRVSWITRRAARLSSDPAWSADLGRLGAEMELTRPVELRRSEAVSSPLTWGWLRPVILLPEDASAWDPSTRRSVLLHELAHIRRLDWPIHLLARVACSLYWFHPLVRHAASQLSLEAERSCDEHVLLFGGRAADYAGLLLDAARRHHARQPALVGTVAMARRSHLECRIRSILDSSLRRTPLNRTTTVLCCLLALGLLGFVASARLVQAETTLRLPLATGEPDPATSEPDPGEQPADEPKTTTVTTVTEHSGDESWSYSEWNERELPLLTHPLLLAAAQGELETMRRLLDEGTDIETLVPGHGTALLQACHYGQLEAVRLLLDRGADIDAGVPGNGNALISAIHRGDAQMTELLLDRGADVNAGVPGNGNALIAAAGRGDRKMMELLLKHGANANAGVPGDGNALTAAARSGWPEALDLLIEGGADLDKAVPGDGNALIEAVESGNRVTVLRLLQAGANVNAAVEGDGSALIAAARNGDLPMARLLVEHEADVNAAVSGDGNPLIAAAAEGRLEMVRFLVEQGAELDLVVPGDENALIQAAASGYLDVVRYLVLKGANVNASVWAEPAPWRPNGEMRTPLSQAEGGGHRAVVEFLIEQGAKR